MEDKQLPADMFGLSSRILEMDDLIRALREITKFPLASVAWTSLPRYPAAFAIRNEGREGVFSLQTGKYVAGDLGLEELTLAKRFVRLHRHDLVLLWNKDRPGGARTVRQRRYLIEFSMVEGEYSSGPVDDTPEAFKVLFAYSPTSGILRMRVDANIDHPQRPTRHSYAYTCDFRLLDFHGPLDDWTFRSVAKWVLSDFPVAMHVNWPDEIISDLDGALVRKIRSLRPSIQRIDGAMDEMPLSPRNRVISHMTRYVYIR